MSHCSAFLQELSLKHTDSFSVSTSILFCRFTDSWMSVSSSLALLPSSAQPFSIFRPPLAPPSALLLYNHVLSYACSSLDALILQMSFLPLPCKKRICSAAWCIEGATREKRMGRRKGGGEHSNMAYDQYRISWIIIITTLSHSLVIVQGSSMTWELALQCVSIVWVFLIF